MTTGERIKEARKYRKMTQKQLAEAAGVATGTIQQYELGKREPRYEILIRICKALNISILVFLIPGSTPIKYLTPEAVNDEINKRNHFDAYIESLGYELFAERDGSLGDVFSLYLHRKVLTPFNGGPLILLSKLYPEGLFLFSLCCLQLLK